MIIDELKKRGYTVSEGKATVGRQHIRSCPTLMITTPEGKVNGIVPKKKPLYFMHPYKPETMAEAQKMVAEGKGLMAYSSEIYKAYYNFSEEAMIELSKGMTARTVDFFKKAGDAIGYIGKKLSATKAVYQGVVKQDTLSDKSKIHWGFDGAAYCVEHAIGREDHSIFEWYIFDTEPTRDDIERAIALDRLESAVFQEKIPERYCCKACGQTVHWLDAFGENPWEKAENAPKKLCAACDDGLPYQEERTWEDDPFVD